MTNSKNAARTLKITSGRMLTNLATMRGKLVQLRAEPGVMPAGLPTDGIKEILARLAFPGAAVPGKNLKTQKFGTEAFRPRLHPIHQTD